MTQGLLPFVNQRFSQDITTLFVYILSMAAFVLPLLQLISECISSYLHSEKGIGRNNPDYIIPIIIPLMFSNLHYIQTSNHAGTNTYCLSFHEKNQGRGWEQSQFMLTAHLLQSHLKSLPPLSRLFPVVHQRVTQKNLLKDVWGVTSVKQIGRRWWRGRFPKVVGF